MIPEDAKKRKDNHIAEGEKTGHYHGVDGDETEVLEDRTGTRYVKAPKGAEVTHQEHNKIKLPPGDYDTGIVQEFDHHSEQAREVWD